PQRITQRLVLLVRVVDVEHDPHRRDEDLARRERAEDADADAPVEAERLQGRLDPAAEMPADASAEVVSALLAGELVQPGVASPPGRLRLLDRGALGRELRADARVARI